MRSAQVGHCSSCRYLRSQSAGGVRGGSGGDGPAPPYQSETVEPLFHNACEAASKVTWKVYVQVIAAAAGDSEAKVREVSLVAVGEMAQHCLPEFAEQSASVLPFLLSALQDPAAKVQARACSALEAYCDHLGAPDMPHQ